MYWPKELTEREASMSIIPRLVDTQDKFISLLDISDSSPTAWKDTLKQSTSMSANLFLKHLMVLADFGGEPIKRLWPEFPRLFPNSIMHYAWEGKIHKYTLKAINTVRKIDNTCLSVDSKGLKVPSELTDAMEDVVMLLLHGSAVVGRDLPNIITEKCIIGALIGDKSRLERFVKQRYIWVSRITCGATFNAMGQLAQDYVTESLQRALPNWTIVRNGMVPGITQNKGASDISFDVVAKAPNGKYVAIEVSFQFTTNSVIERKAGQAKSRAQMVRDAGYQIAYVIDGAGNFEREAALRTICDFSDCTVALTDSEIEVLVEYLKKVGCNDRTV